MPAAFLLSDWLVAAKVSACLDDFSCLPMGKRLSFIVIPIEAWNAILTAERLGLFMIRYCAPASINTTLLQAECKTGYLVANKMVPLTLILIALVYTEYVLTLIDRADKPSNIKTIY